VLTIAISLESFSLRTAVKESNLVRGEQTWVQFVRHCEEPERPRRALSSEWLVLLVPAW
jgi:hypothetical protein